VTADYLALRRDVGAVPLERDVLLATGPDGVAFLQGQLSQDVAGLAPGASAPTLLLDPQGKLVAWLRVSRLGPEELVLDVEAGFGAAVVARLERFKLRTRCELQPLEWRVVALRGPRAAEVDAGPATVVAEVHWPGVGGRDLLGPDVAVPEGVRRCSLDAYEAVRIEAGVPRMGAELVEGLIAAEAGIVEGSVSWTKGCYTGQELVARIDSRGGNTPRRLVGVLVARNVLPPVGATLHAAEAGAGPAEGGKEVGRLTSVAESLDRHAPVALAYLHRSVPTPAELTLRWPGGEAPVRVEDLPLL
jgi:folate-binding protein YgfZ